MSWGDVVTHPLTNIVIGWLLGALTPVISEELTAKRRRVAIQRAIAGELVEFRYRVAMHVFLGQLRFGTFDRPFLEWIYPRLRDYKGVVEGNVAGILGKLLQESDEHIAGYARHDQNKGLSLDVRKIELPYLDSVIAELRLFVPDYQARLLDIRASVTMFNDLLESERFYERYTFEATSAENHAKALRTAQNHQRGLVCTARGLVEKIDEFAKRYPT
jgi:hypothetical protein